MPDDQNGAPDNKLIERLEAIGFTHGGFTVGYTAVPRWRYLKDLTGITDEKSLLKSYDKAHPVEREACPIDGCACA